MNEPYTDPALEHSLLSALLADNSSWEAVADVFRPELFSNPHAREVAAELSKAFRKGKHVDNVLLYRALQDRKSEVPHGYVFGLVGSSLVSVKPYAVALEQLWQGREARRIALELLKTGDSMPGHELVGRFAKGISTVESRQTSEVQTLAEVMVGRLSRLAELAADPSKRQDSWASGFRDLDSITGGFKAGELFTIAARPGVGKTSLIVAVADNIATAGAPVCIFQLEDHAAAVADRALMRRAKIPSHMMRDASGWQKHHWDKAGAAVEQAMLPVYVDDQHQRSMQEITAQMRRMARDKGVKVFILDNLAEVVVDRGDRSDERLDRALGRMAKEYRDTAQSLGCAAVMVVHLNRDIEKRGGSPRLSDIKNSGEVEDASHVVVVLSREQGSERLTVDVPKNRNGPMGSCELRWNGPLMTVENK